MSMYIDSVRPPPRTLTEQEQRLLLKTTGQHRAGFRDHVIFSMALGTALREHEILALDDGDVFHDTGKSRRRVKLRVFKRSNDNPENQEVILPDALRAKLDKFYQWKRRANQSVASEAPLFMSRRKQRLSKRQVRHAFHVWQERAGFERRVCFHTLRHTACSTLYRRTLDIRLTQRFARHKSVLSTNRYAHANDDELTSVRCMESVDPEKISSDFSGLH